MVNSVILDNIETLKKAVKEQIYYKDLNYLGPDKDGNFACLNQDCTIQELKIWLQSGRYDFHRRPDHGGFFERVVIKTPFKTENCPGLVADLKLEVSQKFPYIEITQCEISCNFNANRWECKISAKDKRTGLESSMFETGQTITWDA